MNRRLKTPQALHYYMVRGRKQHEPAYLEPETVSYLKP